MIERVYVGLFVAEGSSDGPLASIVESLFLERNVLVHLSSPDFERLAQRVPKDVRSRVEAGLTLADDAVDVVVVHRDADNVGYDTRHAEIVSELAPLGAGLAVVPVVPIRMTEAWLLLDESAIRQVAGRPNSRTPLGLPTPRRAEDVPDPKAVLRECLAIASETTGRRREKFNERFSQHRRQLLDRLDPHGPVTSLRAWQEMVRAIDQVVEKWAARQRSSFES